MTSIECVVLTLMLYLNARHYISSAKYNIRLGNKDDDFYFQLHKLEIYLANTLQIKTK